MDALITSCADYGLVGVCLAVLAYDVFFLQRKLIAALENNTAALAIFVEVARRCDGRDRTNKQ